MMGLVFIFLTKCWGFLFSTGIEYFLSSLSTVFRILAIQDLDFSDRDSTLEVGLGEMFCVREELSEMLILMEALLYSFLVLEALSNTNSSLWALYIKLSRSIDMRGTIFEMGEVFFTLGSCDLVLAQPGVAGDHGVPVVGPGDDAQAGGGAQGVGQTGDHGDDGEADLYGLDGVAVTWSSQLHMATLRWYLLFS